MLVLMIDITESGGIGVVAVGKTFSKGEPSSQGVLSVGESSRESVQPSVKPSKKRAAERPARDSGEKKRAAQEVPVSESKKKGVTTVEKTSRGKAAGVPVKKPTEKKSNQKETTRAEKVKATSQDMDIEITTPSDL